MVISLSFAGGFPVKVLYYLLNTGKEGNKHK
jgi:hypothetical protein